jgi:outer membrane receptor protein involved in Fe transport
VGFVGAGGNYRQRQNLDAIHVRGVELLGELRRGPWHASAGVSLTDSDVRARAPATRLNGLQPAQTPQLSAGASLGWESGNRGVTFALRHAGGQFEDDLNRQKLPPATTFDVFACWPLSRGLQLIVSAENLLDERVVAAIARDGTVERATPRTLVVGIRLTNFAR